MVAAHSSFNARGDCHLVILGQPENHYSSSILKLHDLLQKRWSALTGHVHQNNFRTTLIEFRKQ